MRTDCKLCQFLLPLTWLLGLSCRSWSHCHVLKEDPGEAGQLQAWQRSYASEMSQQIGNSMWELKSLPLHFCPPNRPQESQLWQGKGLSGKWTLFLGSFSLSSDVSIFIRPYFSRSYCQTLSQKGYVKVVFCLFAVFVFVFLVLARPKWLYSHFTLDC